LRRVEMATRLRRAKDKEGIFKKLVNDDDAPFLQYSHAFLMAACVGYLYKKREPLAAGGEQIPLTVFNDDADLAIINAIAFAETEDLKILLSTEEQLDRKFEIIEEYANGGVRILNDKILNSPGKNIDNLLNHIFEHAGKDEENLDSISGLADDLF
jgi:dnd system-associated protein 4